MKILPIALLTGSFFLATPLLAQTPATNPVSASAKPKSLSSADRPVAKGILESLYLVDHLLTSVIHRKQDEPNLLPEEGWKAMFAISKLKNSFWGETAPLLMASGEKMPSVISPKDRKRLEILSPAKPGDPKAARGRRDDKKLEFGPAWCLLMSEELKEVGKLLEKASKSTDPQMTKLSASWAGPVKDIVTSLEPLVPSKK